jgi:hypothetical protein
MKRPGPHQGIRYEPGPITLNLSRGSHRPAGHFAGGSPRKGHKKDAAGVGTVHDQMRDAVSQRIGFPCACTGDNEKRHAKGFFPLANTMFDGPSLVRVKFVEIGDRHEYESAGGGQLLDQFLVLFATASKEPWIRKVGGRVCRL